MSASVVSLCNRSLLQIGARAQVSSITPSDGSTEANACSVLFTPTFEALARTARWACLRQQATLSLLKAALGTPENPNGVPPLPPVPWLYSYLKPPDALAARFIVPSLPATGTGAPMTTASVPAPILIPGQQQIPFAVAYDTDDDGNPMEVVLTNQSQAILVYTVNQPNPVIWDSLLEQAFVNSLAAFLVPALSLNIQLVQIAAQAAERIIMEARTADGNEGVTSQDHLPDWMVARSGGWGFWRDSGGFISYGGYQNIAWPGWGY